MKNQFLFFFIFFISICFGQSTKIGDNKLASETISCGCTNNEDNNDENKIHFGDTDTKPELLGWVKKNNL